MSVWVGGITAAIGVGTSIYGADKQRKLTNQANDANKAALDEANRQEWAKYLMARGIDPGTSPQVGVIPQNATPINTKLPIWAHITRNSNPSIAPRLSIGNPRGTAAGQAAAAGSRSLANLQQAIRA